MKKIIIGVAALIVVFLLCFFGKDIVNYVLSIRLGIKICILLVALGLVHTGIWSLTKPMTVWTFSEDTEFGSQVSRSWITGSVIAGSYGIWGTVALWSILSPLFPAADIGFEWYFIAGMGTAAWTVYEWRKELPTHSHMSIQLHGVFLVGNTGHKIIVNEGNFCEYWGIDFGEDHKTKEEVKTETWAEKVARQFMPVEAICLAQNSEGVYVKARLVLSVKTDKDPDQLTKFEAQDAESLLVSVQAAIQTAYKNAVGKGAYTTEPTRATTEMLIVEFKLQIQDFLNSYGLLLQTVSLPELAPADEELTRKMNLLRNTGLQNKADAETARVFKEMTQQIAREENISFEEAARFLLIRLGKITANEQSYKGLEGGGFINLLGGNK